MTNTAYVVTDLGPGDGGKGSIVHKLAGKFRAHTVVKRGGAQGSHGVSTSSGERFCFSQWGCGTLEGTPTFLSEQFVVMPHGLLQEADALMRMGISDPFAMLAADENALCATPLHGAVSHLKELARGENARGTVGTGVGVAYRMAKTHPELAIFVRDIFCHQVLREKLTAQCEILREEMQPVIAGDFLPKDLELVVEEANLLFDPGFLEHILEKFREVSERLHVRKIEDILAQDGAVVVESSHGVLTDAEVGLKPHTTALRTLPRFAHEMLRRAGFAGRIVNLGVHRAYSFRHGAGPLPTCDPFMISSLLSGSRKLDNRWQGDARSGPLDLILLNHAIELCGGPSAFDGLAITWLDQIIHDGVWRYCETYANQPEVWQQTGDWAERFFIALPVIERLPINPALSPKEICRNIASIISDKTHIPVRMVSFGPTERDKILL